MNISQENLKLLSELLKDLHNVRVKIEQVTDVTDHVEIYFDYQEGVSNSCSFDEEHVAQEVANIVRNELAEQDCIITEKISAIAHIAENQESKESDKVVCPYDDDIPF